jgi:predicted Zn-dependent protease
MELAADDHAARTLRARGIPVEPLAGLFDHFGERAERMPKFLRRAASYGSTHPASHTRSERLRASAAGVVD